MKRTEKAEQLLEKAIQEAYNTRREFLTPEMFLRAFVLEPEGEAIIDCFQGDMPSLMIELEKQISTVDIVPETVKEYNLLASNQMQEVLSQSEFQALCAGKKEIDVPHILEAMLRLEDSYARYLLYNHTTTNDAELMAVVLAVYNGEEVGTHISDSQLGEEDDDEEDFYDIESDETHANDKPDAWKKLLTCINDTLKSHNPLIGREIELERTIQVLCRKEKNNPLHIGESGVGKTALVYGLASLIESGKVPPRLQGAKIYQMDMSSMVAGTSYRGEFEKRIKAVMNGVMSEKNAIIYIDEIHTLVGTGTIGDSSLDGSNILKPYLEAGEVRFIGSTTYQEYNRYLQKAKGLMRRFQQIDIAEPSVEEAVQILEGLQEKYENYHGVKYADGVVRYAVEAAAKHINDRFLPDKAIDLIDEAAAYRVLHPQMRKVKGVEKPTAKQVVDKNLVNDVLARICKIDPRTLREDDNEQLQSLNLRVKSQIYGQDAAVDKVVEAVEMGKAGLLEENKPIASMLFVGPTGVGKTEVCKVLAQELGIELVRFDMSEYTEKHTVAKLIGSPAGYVGYEDGGLLTDAIRKSPNCVLLLDEIEKAHSDIYNILLQVMDYAKLTDNKGQKSDFRHVILVMTSNAGAQYAHQANVGFGTSVSAGEAMLSTVKKTFKPEFLARLSGTIVFNDMDETMAGMILDKKLRQLQGRLAQRKTQLRLTDASRNLLLQRGFTKKLGAREMDRQINQLLNPLLTRELLYGKLRKGGIAEVDVKNNQLILL